MGSAQNSHSMALTYNFINKAGMSKWAESKYEGEQLEGWFHGKGKYYFPSGVIYEGDFFKGEFHGEGTLIFPNGVRSNSRRGRGSIRRSGSTGRC